jgi:parvulin-like peptidyl-prolyl isomerase
MQLKFTPRSIREIEQEKKVAFHSLLADYSITTLQLFVKKGMGIGITDQQADDAIEEYLKDKGLEELYLDIMEQLQVDGFLPKALKVEQMRKEMAKTIGAAGEQI